MAQGLQTSPYFAREASWLISSQQKEYHVKKYFWRASVFPALTILLLFVTTGSVTASKPSKTSIADHPVGNKQTIHVIEHSVNSRSIDISKGEDKRGNCIVFADPIFDGTDQKQIGRLSGICFSTTNTLEECFGSIALPEGTIS